MYHTIVVPLRGRLPCKTCKETLLPMKLILSNSAIENGNRGCVALSLSAMHILQQLLQEHGQEAEFFLPQSGHRSPGAYSLDVPPVSLRYKAIDNPGEGGRARYIKAWFHPRTAWEATQCYHRADALLCLGQGDSFSDIYGFNRFHSIDSQHVLARLHHLPLCILPQTIGPFEATSVRKQAMRSLNYAKCIMTRDKRSQDYVKQLVPGKASVETIDVAFFMPYEKEEFDKEHVHVGLNVSALLWHGGYTRDNQFGLAVDYHQLVERIIDYFLQQSNVVVHLVPHVVGNQRHVENDYAVSYDLFKAKRHPRLVLAPLFLDPIMAKNYIAGLDFFMGARMHSTIAAFSTGVPVVPMAYSRKFNGLFMDTLSYAHMVDMKATTIDAALELIAQTYDHRKDAAQHILHEMDTTVRERGQLIKDNLTEFLGL